MLGYQMVPSAALTLFQAGQERGALVRVRDRAGSPPARVNAGPSSETPLLGPGFSTLPRHQAAISSTSVGSSSPVPVLLTRLDTGHMRSFSPATDRSNSVLPVPLGHRPISVLSSTSGMRS